MFAAVFVDELSDALRRHEAVSESEEAGLFEHVAPDGQTIVAGGNLLRVVAQARLVDPVEGALDGLDGDEVCKALQRCRIDPAPCGCRCSSEDREAPRA